MQPSLLCHSLSGDESKHSVGLQTDTLFQQPANCCCCVVAVVYHRDLDNSSANVTSVHWHNKTECFCVALNAPNGSSPVYCLITVFLRLTALPSCHAQDSLSIGGNCREKWQNYSPAEVNLGFRFPQFVLSWDRFSPPALCAFLRYPLKSCVQISSLTSEVQQRPEWLSSVSLWVF